VLGTWNSKITPAGRSEWDMVVHHLAASTVQSLPLISQAPALAEVPEFMAADRTLESPVDGESGNLLRAAVADYKAKSTAGA
jgi:hypothetical protein